VQGLLMAGDLQKCFTFEGCSIIPGFNTSRYWKSMKSRLSDDFVVLFWGFIQTKHVIFGHVPYIFPYFPYKNGGFLQKRTPGGPQFTTCLKMQCFEVCLRKTHLEEKCVCFTAFWLSIQEGIVWLLNKE
jgi:hypothetical protein